MVGPQSTTQAPDNGSGGFWRRWNRILHRDVGYFCVALTLVYAVSGIAVNHIDDWNPSYVISREPRRFDPVPVTDRETMVGEIVSRLGLPGLPAESFRRSPERVELFYDGWSVLADAAFGTATIERTRRRFLLFDANYLHLNRPRGLWTWIADVYAALLALLAMTGILILRGRQGLAGRGKWLVLAGLALPVVFLILMRALGSPPPMTGEGGRLEGRRGAGRPPSSAPVSPDGRR